MISETQIILKSEMNNSSTNPSTNDTQKPEPSLVTTAAPEPNTTSETKIQLITQQQDDTFLDDLT